MKRYFKKIGIMFVMSLAVIGVGIYQNGSVANALVTTNDNPIHKYTFDNDNGNTVIDSGTSNNISNGTASGATLKTDNEHTYRNFSGSSWISFNDVLIPQKAKSIKFDIRTKSTSTQYLITNIKDGNKNNGLGISYTSDGKINIELDQSSSTKIFNLQSKKSVNDGNWHTVLFTWDGSTNDNGAKIYIDDLKNTDNTTKAGTQESSSPSCDLCIGCLPDTGLFFTGDLDNIEIYDSEVKYEEKNEELSLDKATINLTEGDSDKLTATTTPSAVGVTWTSNDTSIATIEVDPTNGKIIKVNALKEGTCTITVTTTDGSNLSASCTVNVTKKDTPTPANQTDNKTGAILIINLTDGETKIFDVSSEEIDKFKEWYNTKSEYENKLTYEFDKTVNSNISVEEDVVHEKIASYEIRKY